jgi:hypothetical protein
MNRVRKRVRSERGAELIEFALTLPLLLLLVLGIIEFGFLFQEYEVVTNSAREGRAHGGHDSVRRLQRRACDDAASDYLTAGGLDLAKATPRHRRASQRAIAGRQVRDGLYRDGDVSASGAVCERDHGVFRRNDRPDSAQGGGGRCAPKKGAVTC